MNIGECGKTAPECRKPAASEGWKRVDECCNYYKMLENYWASLKNCG